MNSEFLVVRYVMPNMLCFKFDFLLEIWLHMSTLSCIACIITQYAPVFVELHDYHEIIFILSSLFKTVI